MALCSLFYVGGGPPGPDAVVVAVAGGRVVAVVGGRVEWAPVVVAVAVAVGCLVGVSLVELLLLLSLEVLLLYHWSGFNFVPAMKRRICPIFRSSKGGSKKA